MRNQERRLLLGLCGAILLLAPAPGAAKNLRAGIGMQVGFAGDIDTETVQAGQTAKEEGELEAMFGFAPFIEYRVVKYFSVGAMIGVNFWESEAMDANDIDRNIWVDFDVVLKGHVPIPRYKLDAYLALPVGFTLSVPSEDTEDLYNGKFEEGLGANVSVLAGLSYRIWKKLDVYLELGYQFHYAKHDWTVVGGQQNKVEIEAHQMALNFGAAWNF